MKLTDIENNKLKENIQLILEYIENVTKKTREDISISFENNEKKEIEFFISDTIVYMKTNRATTYLFNKDKTSKNNNVSILDNTETMIELVINWKKIKEFIESQLKRQDKYIQLIMQFEL